MDSAEGVPVADLTALGPAIVALRPEDLADVGEELAAYHAHFAPLFARREQRGWAQVYLRGLLLADVRRKNVEAMACELLARGPDAARRSRASSSSAEPGRRDDSETPAWSPGQLGEPDRVLILDGSDVARRPSAGWPPGGVARREDHPMVPNRASSWATPAARATRCWIGDSSCPRRGSRRTTWRAGRRVASRGRPASRPKPSWERRWWSSCRRGASCPPVGWSATRGLGATRRCWTAWTPPECGSSPK